MRPFTTSRRLVRPEPEVDERSSDALVARREVPIPLEIDTLRWARLASARRTSMRPAFPNQSAFHRRVLSAECFRTRSFG